MARGIAIGGAIAIALLACKDHHDKPRPAPTSTPVPTAPATGDPLANVRFDTAPLDWTKPATAHAPPGDGYAGSLACKPCHEALYKRYVKHSMARTGMRPIETVDPPWVAKIFDAGSKGKVVHTRSGFAYRPFRRGNKFFVEETMLDAAGGVLASWEDPITHLLSAGSYGLALYTKRGNQLVHVPIDYYAQKQKWDLDPMAFGGNPRVRVILDTYCISCHSNDPKTPREIGCERCHGPSKQHVESLKPEDTVNPTHLAALRQVEICTQCHQSTHEVLRAGRDHWSFRPGEAVDEFRVNFIGEPADPTRMKLLMHPERMVRSKCWLASRDKMTCTTCHDPHQSSLEKPPSWWEDTCLKCHTRDKCTDTAEHRAAVKDHCPTCHMRSGTTYEVPNVTITDHWIQRRPPPLAPPGTAPKPQKLVPWSAHVGAPVHGDDMPAATALAYNDAGLGDAALSQAVAAIGTHPTPRVYKLVAVVYLAKKRPADAARAFASALHLDFDDRDALLGYAQVMLDGPQREEGVRALERMLKLDANDVDALETLGIYRFRTGDRSHAMELFQRAAATERASGMTYVALAYDARGNTAKQREWLERAWRAEPRDRWIVDELASNAAASGDKAWIAEVERRRAALEKLTPPPSVTRSTAWLPDQKKH